VHVSLGWKIALEVAFRVDLGLLETICQFNALRQRIAEGMRTTEPIAVPVLVCFGFTTANDAWC